MGNSRMPAWSVGLLAVMLAACASPAAVSSPAPVTSLSSSPGASVAPGASSTATAGSPVPATARTSTGIATSPTRDLTPEQICLSAFDAAVLLDWAPSTVAQFRAYGMGAPVRGGFRLPLAHAFPAVPEATVGAWCSTQEGPRTVHWWAVVVGQNPASLESFTGPDSPEKHGLVVKPPHGP